LSCLIDSYFIQLRFIVKELIGSLFWLARITSLLLKFVILAFLEQSTSDALSQLLTVKSKSINFYLLEETLSAKEPV
jgi:hypothetical protein